MILYHGSDIVVEKIDLNKSKPNKDFGRAFYLSADRKQAEEMAEFKAELSGRSSVVTSFKFDESIMSDGGFNVLRFDGYSKEWAEFVFANRDSSRIFQHCYDIVYGPVANDKVGRQVVNLREGYIDIDTFLNRLKFMGGCTFQYAFCTEIAVSKLYRL